MVINRYGLKFTDNKSSETYKNSGLLWRSYYRLVCSRCGWSFAGSRHLSHRLADCDRVLKERRKDVWVEKHCRVNLGQYPPPRSAS